MPSSQIPLTDIWNSIKYFDQNLFEIPVQSFMNKIWDVDVPSVEIWKACLRVLKHGAFAFIMSSPRQDVSSEMIHRLKLAGFDIAYDPIEWVYSN